MKKILLLTTALAVLGLAGCAEEETPAPAKELSFEEKISKINVNSLSDEEAIYMTIQNLYNVPELSAGVRERVLMVYEGLQNGKIFGTESADAGMGEVKHPAIASAVFQSLYQTVQASNATNLQKLLTYSALDNETIFNEAMNAMLTSEADKKVMQDFIANFKSYVLTSQDNIVNIADKYVTLLLDSSSSASKTAGGGGIVSAKEYFVSANIAYAFAEIAINTKTALNFDANLYPEKVDFLAETLYNLTEETKLRITYDKSLTYFNVLEVIPDFANEWAKNLVQAILLDINTTDQVPGGMPYPATYVVKPNAEGVVPAVTPDATADADNFYTGVVTADKAIYTIIGNYLLGSPSGNSIYAGSDYSQLSSTNMVNNNMLKIYNRLKANGLKAPLTTSSIGANALAQVIAKHLRDNGIVYLNSNVNSNTANNAQTTLDNLINALFTPNQLTGVIPACELIDEYNKTLDDAAIGRPANTGYYTRDASGGLCGIYISDAERKDFNAGDYTANN